MTDRIQKALSILQNGGIVIFPTDTAFGIGCRIDSVTGVDRLFRLRRRPRSQAVPVLVANRAMAEKYLQPLTRKVRDLLNDYWPGGLTIIYPCKQALVPSLVRGQGTTIGVRMPNHATILQIINALGTPVLGPSANFHGLPTPFKFSDLDQNLVKLVDYVLPGEFQGRKASTVVDCSQQPWQIIRQGEIKLNL